MNAPAYEPARIELMLHELRLPTIARLWPDFAQRSDKESWQAARFLATLLEHELAERGKRRIERHRAESHLDPTKTLASFDFAAVPMLSKAHVSALATGDSWLEKGATILIFGPPEHATLCTPRYVIKIAELFDRHSLCAGSLPAAGRRCGGHLRCG